MSTIHDDVEGWLAASVHDQLSKEERASFQEHLAGCETCRALHEEEIAMSKLIETTMEDAKPDLAFEQRIVSRFRTNVPHRTGLVPLLASLMRLRATQIAAVAAVMLTLVQIGRMVTREDSNTGKEASPQVFAAAAVRNERDARLARAKKSDSPAQNGFAASGTVPAPPPTDSFADAVRSIPAAPGTSVPLMGKAEPQSAPEKLAERKSDDASAPAESAEGSLQNEATTETAVAAGSDISTPEAQSASSPGAADANRKLVRNAQVELEVIKFDEAVEKITTFAAEDHGYVATSSSAKQENGKLRGTVVVKVLPEKLDVFLLKVRELGELKNQTLGTEDVTKQYFDTDSRLKNARVMEQRLIDILKTKSTKVADLLEVEKELGRVREQIEQMQGALKYMDAQVQFATVTITLAEKDMNVPAAFLLKRKAQLALFSMDVEKTFSEVRSVIDGTKAQVSSSTLERDSSGEATARLVLLIVPEEADALISRIKGMGRVQNYNEQTDRVAQGGTGMAENAKVERDKVELSITISRNEQEPALQTTTLSILTSAVTDKVARLKENAASAGAEIRSSSFNRNPDGQEVAYITLRVPMKNYAALLGSFDQLGKVKDVSVQREDRRGTINEETAPADISIQVYSQPNIVSDETGLLATIRHTLAQGVSALMWSLRMIGVAVAFLAPWVLALAFVGWILKRISRARAARHTKEDASE